MKIFEKNGLWRTVTACAAAFALGLGMLLLFHTRGKLLRPYLLSHLIWLAPGIVFAEMLRRKQAFLKFNERRVLPVLVLCFFMVLYLCSSAVDHGWFYFLGWTPGQAAGRPVYGLLVFVLFAALLSPFMLNGFPRKNVWLFSLLIVLQALCFGYLWLGTGGRALYSDDHPSFMFRLVEFSRTFPQLINYNPYWNGGVVDNVGVTSGTIAFGLPFLPFLKFVQVDKIYTFMFAVLYIGIIPWLAVMSVRIAGGSRASAFSGGIIALGVSRLYFLWMLHYGTIGACFAASFLMPVSACAFRIVKMGRMEKWVGVILVVSSFFLLLWPPGAIMGLFAGLSVLLHFRSWTWKKILFLAVCGVLVGVLFSRNLAVLLFANKDLFGFVLEPGSSGSESGLILNAGFFKKGFLHLAAYIQEGNPLLIFLGIGGLIACGNTALALWYFPIFAGLAVCAGWGRDFGPNLQLGRMAIPMMFSLVVPAAFSVGRVFQTKHPRLMLPRAILLVLLVLGGWNAGRIYGNRGRERYVTRGELVDSMVEWVRDNTPEGARVMFAGRTVHICGRGHAAVLPVFTGREMMACDYYHFPPEMVEYEYPPRVFRSSDERTMDFFDLYNVSAIFTYHGNWKEFFRRYPDVFEESITLDAGGGHVMSGFLLKRPAPGLFYKGNGSVRASFNMIEVKPEDSESEIVLRYNWHPELSVQPPAKIYPVEVDKDAVFIGIAPEGAERVFVEFKGL